MPKKNPPTTSGIYQLTTPQTKPYAVTNIDEIALAEFLNSVSMKASDLYDRKQGANSRPTASGEPYLTEIFNKADEEKFHYLLKSGSLDLLYNLFEDYNFFLDLKPANYQKSTDKQKKSTDIDFEYIEKKFSILMDLYEYFIQYKTIFETETGHINFMLELSDEDKDRFKNFCSYMNEKNQQGFEETLKFYTENLVNSVQKSVYKIELEKQSQPKRDTLGRIQSNPQNKLSEDTVKKLQEMQANFEKKSKKILEDKSAIFEQDKKLYGKIGIDEFIKICQSKKDSAGEHIQSVMGTEEDLEQRFPIIATSLELCEKSSFYGNHLRAYLSSLPPSGARNNSLDLDKHCAQVICYGFSEFLKVIPQNQKHILKKLLLSEDEGIFKTEDLETKTDDGIRFHSTPKEFDELLKEHYFRLNIPALILGNSGDFHKNPASNFPRDFKKNLFNIALFNQDCEALTNFPLDLMTHQNISKPETELGNDNALELFFNGLQNNSVNQAQTANTAKKLMSYGFSVSKNLKLGSFDDLIKKINKDFEPGIAKDLENNLKVIKEFEEKLINFSSESSDSLSSDNIMFKNEISEILSIFLKNKGDQELPIEKTTNQKKLLLKNVVNSTGFLSHLSNLGFIKKLSSSQDASSKNLMGKIDSLIDKLNENNPIFQEKQERKIQLLLHESSIGNAPTKDPPEVFSAIKMGSAAETLTKDDTTNTQKPSDEGTTLNDEKAGTTTPEVVSAIKMGSAAETLTKDDTTNTQKPSDEDTTLNDEKAGTTKGKIDAIETKITIEAGKNFDKFTPFFDFLRQKKWVGLSEVGLYGSKVYRELIKITNPDINLRPPSHSDYDFFGVSDQIFIVTPNKISATENFKGIIEEFNEKNPNYQISFAEENPENSVNFSKQKQSLNYKLKATINGEEHDFDLNFYSSASILENMQWQLNFERMLIVQQADHTTKLQINESGSQKGETQSVDDFLSESQFCENPFQFLFSTNIDAKNFLKRLYNDKGIYKYLNDDDLNSVKKFLLENKKSQEKLIEEYQSYKEMAVVEGGKKSIEANLILQKIDADPVFKALKTMEIPSRQPESPQISEKRIAIIPI